MVVVLTVYHHIHNRVRRHSSIREECHCTIAKQFDEDEHDDDDDDDGGGGEEDGDDDMV